MKGLIIYSSVDGHTKKISERILSKLDSSDDYEIISLDDLVDDHIEKADKILVGASIRYGKYRKNLLDFFNSHSDVLIRKKTAFFSVNVVARKEGKNKPKNNPYLIKLLKKISFKPDLIEVFAGVVDYPKYNFFDKYIILFIMFLTKGPKDLSKTHEFTDWDKVDLFAKLFSDLR